MELQAIVFVELVIDAFRKERKAKKVIRLLNLMKAKLARMVISFLILLQMQQPLFRTCRQWVTVKASLVETTIIEE